MLLLPTLLLQGRGLAQPPVPAVRTGVSLQWSTAGGVVSSVGSCFFSSGWSVSPSHVLWSFPASTRTSFLVTRTMGGQPWKVRLLGRGMLSDLCKVLWSVVSCFCFLACGAINWKLLGFHPFILDPAALGVGWGEGNSATSRQKGPHSKGFSG